MATATALLLDLDGTVLDGSGDREAIRRACTVVAEARPTLQVVQLVHANAEVWQQFWPEIEERWTLGRVDGASVSLEAWRRTLRACGCNDESVIRLARASHARFQRGALRLFDDARELLDSLRGRVPLALVSNGASDTQRAALRVLGIEDRLAAVVISGETGVAKPDPRAFGVALERLGVRPSEAWHVGDSLSTDVAGAKAAGLTAAWLNRDGVPQCEAHPRPDHEVRSLTELVHLVVRE